MKITTLNNSEIVIQANTRKDGDWEKVKNIAGMMIENAPFELVAVSCCEDEQWFHLAAACRSYQARDIKDTYDVAKKSYKKAP